MTIRRQMIAMIALPTLAIYILVIGLTIFLVYRDSERAVQRDMTRLASNYAARFDWRLRAAARIADITSGVMETVPNVSDEEVYTLLARNVAQSELVYGACMAFEPGRRRPAGTLFAPYVCRTPSGGLRQMNIDESVYDWYRDPSFTWYSRPKSLGRGVWSEPYFDEGAGNILMSTYSAPFRQAGEFGGVNTVDIDLPHLRDTVGREIDGNLDFVVLAPDGKFVFHPDPQQILSRTIFDSAAQAQKPGLATLGRDMLRGVPGSGAVSGWDSPGRQLVFYAPIVSSGWVLACRVPESAVLAGVRQRTMWTAAALTLAPLLTIGSIFLVSRRITGPIAGLRTMATRIAGGDLDARIDETADTEEIRQLASSFNRMTADLRGHIHRLASETAARRQIEHDLEIARDIQRSLLPIGRPDLPAYEVYGWSQPASQTGGDYYDWQTLPDGRTIITLADASGHGIGPALVTAVCRAYARASFASLRSLGRVISQVNDLLVPDLPSGRFVTLVAVLLNPDTNEAEIISAGHGPTLHYIVSEHRLVQLETTNVPLGVMPDVEYGPESRLTLAPGDLLILLTDGFFEWTNPEGKLFGIPRLEQTLLEIAHLPCAELVDALHERVRRFGGATPQADDATAVVIKRREQ